MDDPLFLWAAEQIQRHPFDVYGRQVNWFGSVSPLFEVMKNPPLSSYYLALAAALFGWSEWALHAACLLPAIGAVWGTWYLARSFCPRPVFAALVVLATPGFLVSSTNVMCDTTMLCFWIWAIALWRKGVDCAQPNSIATAECSRFNRWLASASLLVAAAALTKYFAMSLVPLLVLYTIIRERKLRWKLAWMLVPIAVLAGYQVWTSQQYGRGLLSDAAVYVRQIGPTPEYARETFGSKTIVLLSFTGGVLLPVFFFMPWLWRTTVMAVVLLVSATIGLVAIAIPPSFLAALHMDRGFTFLSALQFGLFSTGGMMVVWILLTHLVNRRSSDDDLLSAWVLGTLVFAGFVNWTCNVRSLLPMVPALAILLVRRLEKEGGQRSNSAAIWRLALAPAAAVALMVGWADLRIADSDRTAAGTIAARLRPQRKTVWFEGHWGFQYYIEAEDARAVDFRAPLWRPGDFLVTPYNNTNVFFPQREMADRVDELQFPVCGWLSTCQDRAGAGFYSSLWGPLPFVFGPIPPEKYAIWRFKGQQAMSGRKDSRLTRLGIDRSGRD